MRNDSSEGIGLDHWGTKYLWPFYSNKKSEAIKADTMISAWSVVIKHYFLEIYPPDGIDLISKTFHGKQCSKNEYGDILRGLQLNFPFHAWTSFFGFPNQKRKQELDNSQILKIFFDWPDEEPQGWAFVGHCFKAIFHGLKNTGRVILTTAWNIGKLFTEFLPTVLEISTFKAIAELKETCTALASSRWEKVAAGAGIVLLTPFYYTFKVWRLLGRAITSPAASMKAAWQAGVELGDWEVNGYKIPIGKIIGSLLAALSLAITIAAYVIIFPLGVKAAITHGPAFIAEAFHWVANSSVVQGLGHAISQAVNPFVSMLKATVFQFKVAAVGSSYSTAVAALTAIIVPIRAVWSDIKAKCRSWWGKTPITAMDDKHKSRLAGTEETSQLDNGSASVPSRNAGRHVAGLITTADELATHAASLGTFEPEQEHTTERSTAPADASSPSAEERTADKSPDSSPAEEGDRDSIHSFSQQQ
jgi:hypothetical protein